MRHRRLQGNMVTRSLVACVLIAFVLIASSCGAGTDGSSGETVDKVFSEEGGGGTSFVIPGFRGVSFDEEAAEGNDKALVDTSRSAEGYFGVRAESESRMKLQVVKDDENYVYDLPSGKAQFFPFQLGDGRYSIRVMQNAGGDKYSELYAAETDVKLKSEFEPFLRPGQYAAYSEGSRCVQLARELAGESEDVNDYIAKVYEYICGNITYDSGKAESVSSGYIPDPDEVLESGKGICFDYASLAASMLRSMGVPAKIIFGYVGSEGDLYHAWNMFYTEESGWVAAEFRVDPDSWNRLDLTFSANGENSDFIGDGTNYTDVFVY